MDLLESLFQKINQLHFDDFLDLPLLTWNSRLRSSAGRFLPGRRSLVFPLAAKIEIASYLREEPEAEHLVQDTLGHEMIHFWLWLRRRPYGHNPEFYSKMRAMGVSRYNPVPRLRASRYLYRCNFCQKTFPARKRLGLSACARCCQEFAHGKFDARFQLVQVV